MNTSPLVYILAQEGAAIGYAETLIQQGYRTRICTGIGWAINELATFRPTVMMIEDHFIEGFRDVLEVYDDLHHTQPDPPPMVLLSSRHVPDGKVAALPGLIAFDLMERYNALEYLYRTFPTARTALWYPSHAHRDAPHSGPPGILVLSTRGGGSRFTDACHHRGYTTWLATHKEQVERMLVRVRPALLLLDDASRDDQSAMESYCYVRHYLNDPIPIVLVTARLSPAAVRGLDLVRFEPSDQDQALGHIDHIFRGRA